MSELTVDTRKVKEGLAAADAAARRFALADLPTGWLTEAEAEVLTELAAGKEVLEIGSYLGRSACAMAPVAKRLWSLDWHRGDEFCGPTNPSAVGLYHNLAARGLLDKVVMLIGRSEDAGPKLGDRTFDLAFIDGAHDEESVSNDTQLAARVVMPGGLIVWHDWDLASVRGGARFGLDASELRAPGEPELVVGTSLATLRIEG